MSQRGRRCATFPTVAGVIVTFASFVPSAAAPARPVGDVWLRAETANFTLLGDVPEARLRRIADLLETYRNALESLHPGSRPSPRETAVYVFSDATTGWRYTPAPGGGGHPLGVNPLYDAPNFVTVAAPLDDPPLEVLYHACVHQFLDDNFPRLPLTVTEGLAEFYSRFTTSPEGTLIGIANQDHLRWLREHPLPSLADQFALAPQSRHIAEGPGQTTFMAASWALMHYLVSGSGERRAGVPKFLETLQRGVSPPDATQMAFGIPIARLQQEVADYVAGSRHLPIRIRPGGGKAGEVPPSPAPMPFPVRRMERDEVQAALGALIAHGNARRAPDAEAHLQSALNLNPSQARAYAGLGHLRYAQDRPAEAIPLLEKAIAIEPDAMSCYLLAKLLYRTNAPAPPSMPATDPTPSRTPQTTGTGPAGTTPVAATTPPWLNRVRELLDRAITLRPRFAASYVLLGATHIEPDGDVSAGIDLLQKAHTMLPARTDILTNLVYLLLRNGDLIRAQAVVDGALAMSGDLAALEKGRRAIATFQQHLEARQSLYLVRETPSEQARRQAWQTQEAKLLREALARTQDPEERARIEAHLKLLESSSGRLTSNEAVAIYNEAVDSANKRDYTRALALLEGLLPKVENPDLRQTIESMLVRFRQDAARLQRPPG